MKPGWVDEHGIVSASAFEPDLRTAGVRADGGTEVSINWEDDGNVVDFTIAQRDEHGNFRFQQFGAIRTPLDKVATLNGFPGTRDTIFFERAVIEDNPYHGNLVYIKDLPKNQRTLAMSILAASSVVAIR